LDAVTFEHAPARRNQALASGDRVMIVLLSLLGVSFLVVGPMALMTPSAGYISELDTVRGGGPSCSFTGRITQCSNDIDYSDLAQDASVFDENDLECHQVAFRSPGHLLTGHDCVDEATWQELEVGDYYETPE